MTIRAVGKICWFAAQVMATTINYFFTVTMAFPKNKRLACAAWLQWAARQHLKIFGCSTTIEGTIPHRGLLVANHLSYFDILVIGATTPAVFVSKADVRRWPVFGWLASLAGTVFIERERRTHVGAVNREIDSALVDGALVVVFPEGTSSNGEQILPFRSPLLEPALRNGAEISLAWIHYELADGDARKEVCYWGDHTFFPHLLNLLGKKSVQATLRFGTFQKTTCDRKELAEKLREEICRLKINGTSDAG